MVIFKSLAYFSL